MKWTQERPTREGWYWARMPGCRPFVTNVTRNYLGHLLENGNGIGEAMHYKVEWYGPLTPPGTDEENRKAAELTARARCAWDVDYHGTGMDGPCDAFVSGTEPEAPT